MVLAWQPADQRSDPHEPEFHGDPAELVDAFGELLEVLNYRPDWHRRAACRGKGPRLWFPRRGEDTIPARSVCADCAVRSECGEAGMSERHGLWGGLSERQRRTQRRTAA